MISGNKEVNNEVQSVTKGDCRRRQGAYYKFTRKTANKVKKRLGDPTNPTWLAQRRKLASSGELNKFARQWFLSFVIQGQATAKEFYKRHHRWTEGLISAAKAVGWGAKVLV